ncbi:MAG: response regulator transcription factor [Crocinitomicaceae bacterium]|nr:response regulator transcription factor [Crocinitomicaceae bacterium]
MKVGIAEDHDILRETMSKLLIGEDNIEVVVQASNGSELLAAMLKNHLDIIILDLKMPIMDGRETIKVLSSSVKDRRPGVIILSMHDTEEHIRKYIGMGANAFLSKGCDYSELLSAINDVHKKGFHFNKMVTRDLVSNIFKMTRKITLDNPLSQREIQILQYICKQKTSSEIAKALKLSLRTVENHRLHIMRKIGARNGIGLLVYAMKNGLLDIEQL